MKNTILFTALFLAMAITLSAQPVIDKYDMPKPGDTIFVYTAINLNNIDYTVTGDNYDWDFSSFAELLMRTDTFVSVTSTSQWYYPAFNNPGDPVHKATVAQKQQDINLQLIQLSEVYNFYQASASSYTQVGQAFGISGFPFPTKYNDPDLLYKFPMTMGDKDSSYYSYLIQIPALGDYGQSRKRVTEVDGWGTVITPYDTFPAFRVLSTSFIKDTIHLDTFGGFGFSMPRTEIEYKWIADNMGIPVFKATKTIRNTGTTVAYEYICQNPDNSGINELRDVLTFATVYPNPADENTRIYFSLSAPGNAEITVTDITGRILKTFANTQYPGGFNSVSIGKQLLSKGIYFINIKSENNSTVLKLQVI